MFRFVNRLLFAIFMLVQFESPLLAQSLPQSKQLDFAGLKLGTDARILGIKRDDHAEWYRFKDKFQLSVEFNEKEFPIYKIAQDCSLSNATDNLLGIQCFDDASKILDRFGAAVVARCTTYDAFDWETQFEPGYFYMENTNHFWQVDIRTKKVVAFGIALPNKNWDRCIRNFSDVEISKIKLGMDAHTILGENFRTGYLGRSYLNSEVTVRFSNAFVIREISFDCDRIGIASGRYSGLEPYCGTEADVLSKKLDDIVFLCTDYGFLRTLYRSKTKEYWGITDGRVVEFGLSEDPLDTPCDKLQPAVKMVYEANSRKTHTAPVPLRADGNIMKIKGIALGDGPSSCRNIETVSFSVDRKYLNICTLKDGENESRVYYDIDKKFVVKIERDVYVNDWVEFIDDALQFYGKHNFLQKRYGEFEFGDVKKTRGLMFSLLDLVPCRGCTSRFVVTILMIDVPAYLEAEADGIAAFRKKEF